MKSHLPWLTFFLPEPSNAEIHTQVPTIMRYLQIAVVFVSLLLLTGCPSSGPNGSSQNVQPAATEAYVHEPSGFEFPPNIAAIARIEVKKRDAEGRAVSVTYGFLQTAYITVAISPANDASGEDALASHLQKCAAEILGEQDKLKKVSDDPAQIMASGKERKARHAVFTYRGFFINRQEALRCDVYDVPSGNWYITYFVTYPQSERESGERVCKDFIDTFAWPAEKEKEKAKDK
jgi:hypothetical protein